MNWWHEYASRIECDAPIGLRTWFRVGGRARYLFRPHSVEELASLIVRARHENVPLKVLGSGANVLVSDDGFNGVVVRLDDEAFSKVDRCDNSLTVGAGVDLIPLARRCSERGLSGLECMAGIPSTVGGAVRMNAGGRFGEFGQVVREADLLRGDGEIECRSHDQIGFRYRHSDLRDEIVLSVRLDLVEDDPRRVTRRFDECFSYKRNSQPLTERSAGCVFKNPDGQSAGALIDKARLKGSRYGDAQVSEQHANFIVTGNDATASDVLRLIDLVRERVYRVFSVELELEIEVWGGEPSRGL